MPIIEFEVVLQGKDQLHEPKVTLEKLPITLRTTDGEKWQNNAVKIPVDDILNILMEVFAVSGTEWTFTIKLKKTGDTFFEKEGETGDTDVNFSRLKDSKKMKEEEKENNITEINV